MKKGIASPEVNTSPSLTIPAQTRSPLEAFKMHRAGQPIDLVTSYYEDREMVTKDFYLMDKTERLRILADFRAQEAHHKSEYNDQLKQYQSQLKQEKDELERNQTGNNNQTQQPEK